ncbi:hypothetical protein NJ7G_3453 [Natrinema sp. J7-2]|nr:hypothetical protein NJ7G_3453 [Natrinema sp. J7-2]
MTTVRWATIPGNPLLPPPRAGGRDHDPIPFAVRHHRSE